jgi:hypothetical protein
LARRSSSTSRSSYFSLVKNRGDSRFVITSLHLGTCRKASSKMSRVEKRVDSWMFGVQDPIKIKKHDGSALASETGFQVRRCFLGWLSSNETSWSWSFWSRWVEIGKMSSRKRAPPQADFGQALQRLRAAQGLVQEDMLPATSRRHISRIERGHQVPSIRTVEVLAEQLQIHPLTLIAAAYCPDLNGVSVNELLKTIKTDFKGIVSD